MERGGRVGELKMKMKLKVVWTKIQSVKVWVRGGDECTEEFLLNDWRMWGGKIKHTSFIPIIGGDK